MDNRPPSNRPTPRTPAAVEAELRRRIRLELSQARQDADGELDDAALAAVIARAIGQALGWHVEAPEHTRNATLSSRTWRGAGGPRGGRGSPRDQSVDRGSRPRDPADRYPDYPGTRSPGPRDPAGRQPDERPWRAPGPSPRRRPPDDRDEYNEPREYNDRRPFEQDDRRGPRQPFKRPPPRGNRSTGKGGFTSPRRRRPN